MYGGLQLVSGAGAHCALVPTSPFLQFYGGYPSPPGNAPGIHAHMSSTRTHSRAHREPIPVGQPAPISSHIPRVVLVGGCQLVGGASANCKFMGVPVPSTPWVHTWYSRAHAKNPCPSPPPPGCTHLISTPTCPEPVTVRTHNPESVRKGQTHTCTYMCAQVQYLYVYP